MVGGHNKTIHVGNLAFATTEETLEKRFSAYGSVLSVHLVRHRESGASRGFGYLKMPREAALQAIAALDGQVVDGRTMRVSEAQPRHERPTWSTPGS